MSIAAIVTRGFGSFSTVNFLPTLGYGDYFPATPPSFRSRSGPDEDDDELLDAKHEKRYPKLPEPQVVVEVLELPIAAPPVSAQAEPTAVRRRRRPDDSAARLEIAQALTSAREAIAQANGALQDEVTLLMLKREQENEELELIAMAVAIAMDDE